MRTDKRNAQKVDKKAPSRAHKRGVVGYSKKSALLEEAITHMNGGKYGRSSAALKELLALDPHNTEARRLFATLHLRLGSLVTARQAFESLANEAIGRQDYWLAESLLREYLAAGPRCVPFLELLAHVYQEKGDELAAVGELGKAIEILRDDPDSDNPQKAAQFYAKIRELAPASSVALELAPLFDVQTGEFLVRPSRGEMPTSTHEAHPQESTNFGTAEPPLPEVLPWEVIDGSDPSSPQDQQLAIENGAAENIPDALELNDGTAGSLPSTSGASSDGFSVSESADASPLTSSSNGSSAILGISQSSEQELESNPISDNCVQTEPTNGIPSPMPWEQVADASIQISEPESPPAPDPHLALESILASMRKQDVLAASPAVVEESVAPPIEIDQPSTMSDSIETANVNPSPPLSSPMPWEQISDEGTQIPESETRSAVAAQESLSPAVTEQGWNPSLTPATDSVVPDAANLLPVEPEHSSTENAVTHLESPVEPLANTAVEESPRPSSFSWNSVFDRAMKFAAGTMAPSAERELEKDAGSITENLPSKADLSSGLTDDVPTTDAGLQAADIAPPTPEPIMPASFSTVTEEQTIPEPEPGTWGQPIATDRSAMESSDKASSPLKVDETLSKPDETHSSPGAPSHWNTGEVAVQVHRPSEKKKRWEKEPEIEEAPAIPRSTFESLSESLSEAIREWKSAPAGAAVSAVEKEEVSPQADRRPDWMQASDAITLSAPAAPPPKKSWSDSEAVSAEEHVKSVHTAAASAVDVLFSPSTADDQVKYESARWSKPRPRLIARLHRIRIGVFSLISSCFSTTRSLTFLLLMLATTVVVVAAAGIGALSLTWMAMEVQPSSLYHNLTITPMRVVSDVRKNGYFLLLGFDAPVGQDPVQAGYDRKSDERDMATAKICMAGEDGTTGSSSAGASAHLVKGWFRSADPAAQIKGQSETIRSLANRESTALARYQQWLTMPFDDWGYGQLLSPNCDHVLLAHRLFLLEGFNQDTATGLDRLEDDIQAWRGALGQSKTLMTKMLAVTAIEDDAFVASGLLTRSDLDSNSLGRLSKMVRPLDQVELSVRWPMQSHFVWATKSLPAELKEDKSHDRPWHASMVAAMRLPIQRRANAYAEYYEASNKAVAGGRYTNLPKVSAFVRTPATGLMDYLANPIEHIIGIEPLPSWEPYVMRMIETDAHLRLVGLQAWLRRGPQEGDVLTRLAKAGQAYYDPFTGLPMLVNRRKGLIYSVGRDGKDQEGDRVYDVAVSIPSTYSSSAESKTSRASSLR